MPKKKKSGFKGYEIGEVIDRFESYCKQKNPNLDVAELIGKFPWDSVVTCANTSEMDKSKLEQYVAWLYDNSAEITSNTNLQRSGIFLQFYRDSVNRPIKKVEALPEREVQEKQVNAENLDNNGDKKDDEEVPSNEGMENDIDEINGVENNEVNEVGEKTEGLTLGEGQGKRVSTENLDNVDGTKNDEGILPERTGDWGLNEWVDFKERMKVCLFHAVNLDSLNKMGSESIPLSRLGEMEVFNYFMEISEGSKSSSAHVVTNLFKGKFGIASGFRDYIKNIVGEDVYGEIVELTKEKKNSKGEIVYTGDLDIKNKEHLDIVNKVEPYVKGYVKSFIDFYYRYQGGSGEFLNYHDIFLSQGNTFTNLRFDLLDHKDENVLYNDYPRNVFLNIETHRKASLFQTAIYFNRNILSSEKEPNEDELKFYLALSCMLPEEEQKKLQRVLNGDKLTEDEKELRRKCLSDDPNYKRFRNDVVNRFEKMCGDMPREEIRFVKGQNIAKYKLPNRYLLAKILHYPDNELNEEEKDFKKEFLEAMASDSSHTPERKAEFIRKYNLNVNCSNDHPIIFSEPKSVKSIPKFGAGVEKDFLEKLGKVGTPDELLFNEDFFGEANRVLSFTKGNGFLKSVYNGRGINNDKGDTANGVIPFNIILMHVGKYNDEPQKQAAIIKKLTSEKSKMPEEYKLRLYLETSQIKGNGFLEACYDGRMKEWLYVSGDKDEVARRKLLLDEINKKLEEYPNKKEEIFKLLTSKSSKLDAKVKASLCFGRRVDKGSGFLEACYEGIMNDWLYINDKKDGVNNSRESLLGEITSKLNQYRGEDGDKYEEIFKLLTSKSSKLDAGVKAGLYFERSEDKGSGFLEACYEGIVNDWLYISDKKDGTNARRKLILDEINKKLEEYPNKKEEIFKLLTSKSSKLDARVKASLYFERSEAKGSGFLEACYEGIMNDWLYINDKKDGVNDSRESLLDKINKKLEEYPNKKEEIFKLLTSKSSKLDARVKASLYFERSEAKGIDFLKACHEGTINGWLNISDNKGEIDFMRGFLLDKIIAEMKQCQDKELKIFESLTSKESDLPRDFKKELHSRCYPIIKGTGFLKACYYGWGGDQLYKDKGLVDKIINKLEQYPDKAGKIFNLLTDTNIHDVNIEGTTRRVDFGKSNMPTELKRDLYSKGFVNIKGSGFLKACYEGEMNDKKDFDVNWIIEKLKKYPENKQRKIFNLLTSQASKLAPNVKQALVVKKFLDEKDTIRKLARGEINLDKDTAFLFLYKIHSIYGTDVDKTERLMKAILNDPKNTKRFKDFVRSRLYNEKTKLPRLKLADALHKLKEICEGSIDNEKFDQQRDTLEKYYEGVNSSKQR